MAEHLFGESRSPPQPLQIEYDYPLYDGQPWISYPQRLGWPWKPEDINDGSRQVNVPHGQERYITTWLYLGLLDVTFNDLDQQDFLRVDSETNKQYISTAHLSRYVGKALKFRGKKGKDGQRLVFARCSRHDWEEIDAHADFLVSQSGAAVHIKRDMNFGIMVLHATLKIIFHRLIHSGDGMRGITIGKAPATNRDDWAVTELRQRGLCLSETVVFSWCASVLPQAFALQLNRPSILSDDQRGARRSRHLHCIETKCSTNQLNKDESRTKHRLRTCKCDFVPLRSTELGVDEETDFVSVVKTILRDGAIPLIRIQHTANQKMKSEAVRYRPGRRYVALSHVWSDGMGNSHRNALPLCQLRWLQSQAVSVLWDLAYVPGDYSTGYDAVGTVGRRLIHAVNRASRSKQNDTLFWIDTLCVPVGEDNKETRKLAIRGMREVYKKGDIGVIA